MSFDKKPEIFEDVDDALFQRLPPNYRLMESGSGMQVQVDHCDFHNATINLEPFHRPITKILRPAKTEEGS